MNGRANRPRAGMLGGAAVAPLVAGLLALLAAGLLVTFSLWAQNVVSQHTDRSEVGVKQPRTKGGPVVVQAVPRHDGKKGSHRGPGESNEQAVALEIINSQPEFQPAGTQQPSGGNGTGKGPGKGPNKGPDKGPGPGDGSLILTAGHLGGPFKGPDKGPGPGDGPIVLVAGHLSGPIPAGTTKGNGSGGGERAGVQEPTQSRSLSCLPRKVRGAPKNERRVPPGHSKPGETDGHHSTGHGKKDNFNLAAGQLGDVGHCQAPDKHDRGNKHGKTHGHGHAGDQHEFKYTQGHRWGGPDRHANRGGSEPSKGHSKNKPSKFNGSKSKSSKTHGSGHKH